MTNSRIAQLRFPITQALYTQWGESHPDFFELLENDPSSAHLVLHLSPEDYKPVEEELGDNNITPGYAGMQVVVANRLYGFEVSTTESEMAPYETLKTLARNAAKTPGLYKPIAVLDGHYVDPAGDNLTIGEHRYTRRFMRMMSLSLQAGSLVRGTARYSTGGFTFRLMEFAPRDFY